MDRVRKHPLLYDKGNALYRQVAILLPNYGNLREVFFDERFLGHPRFGLIALCPCIRRFRFISQRPRIRTENATSTSTSSAMLGCSNARAYLTVLAFELDV